MNIKKITSRLLYQLPSDKKPYFESEIRSYNLSRSIATTLFFFIVQSISVLIFYSVKKAELLLYPNYVYILLYLLIITVMPFFLFFFVQLKKKPEYKIRYKLCIIVFAIFLNAWSAAVSLLDQTNSDQIIIYTVAVICLGIFPFFPTRILLLIYLPVHIIFLLLLPTFQHISDRVYANSVNSTITVLIALIISRSLFQTKMEDFMNKTTIVEKNRVLRELNDQLTRVNSQLTKANAQLEHLSITDSLTGLLNRRKIDEISGNQWNVSKKHSLPLSVIMMDIDSFKRYNDRFGHQYGDECIIKVTHAIQKSLRASMDYAARYGGDEFIIILTQTSLMQAYQIAERLRISVEDIRIPANAEGTEFVTISLGVCSTIPRDDLTVKDLISVADQALYQAKSQSRNKSVALEL